MDDSRNQSYMMTNVLSEDLIVEIFSRLQIKSLLRFRSISKSLRACIDSPSFIRLHMLRSPKKTMIIHKGFHDKRVYTVHSEDQLSNKPYIGITPIEYPFRSFNIVGSCNGILCVSEFGAGIYLWNPSIRRKVNVHDLRSRSLCSRVIGFGFDPIIKDYKILRTSKVGSFVYTMKTHTWYAIASPASAFSFVNDHQCLFNGALHWVVKRNLTRDICHYYILTFDLSSEVFSTIELPEPSWETFQVTIIKGCLAVISLEDNGHSWIWVRREYSKTDASWSIAFVLNTNPFKGVTRVFERAINGDLLLRHYSKGIRVYNPEKEIDVWSVQDLNYYLIVDMNMYVESLELLDVGTSYKRSKSPTFCWKF